MQESFTPSHTVNGGAYPCGAQKDQDHVGKEQK